MIYGNLCCAAGARSHAIAHVIAPGIAPAVVLALCGVALAPGTVLAQDSSRTLEEIVVTAERRATALQDTPLSIVAFSTESLERKGVEDVADIALFTPNLGIQGSRGYGNNQPTFSIRGISGGGGATSERGVALYIDGIYVPRTNGSVFKVFDIERIEVLRGPQGTLFGRNSTGGAIRLVTKQPVHEFESYVRATVGNFERREVSGMINLPLSDRVALRAQGAYLNQDGYVTRGTQELGGSEDWLGRLQLAVDFTDNVNATFGFLYSDSRSDGSPQDLETFDMAPGIIEGNYADWLSDAFAAVGEPRLEAVDDPRLVLDDFTMPDICLLDDFDPDWDAACEQFNDNEYYQADANIQWSLGENLTLTSITGYAQLDHTGVTDWQLLGTERRPDDVESKVLYQEFQLNAALAGGAVDLITGINYFREESSTESVLVNRRGTSSYSPATGAQSPNGDGDAGLFYSNHTAIDQTSDSFGWFNSATWHATDKLNLTGGVRLAYDKKDIDQTRFPTEREVPPWSPAPGTDSTTISAEDSWTELDWRLTLDYHFTPDLMAYATASKAYRAGQYSLTVLRELPADQQSDDPVPPEQVINYEIGARSTWFDGRLRVNPTAFYMQWSSRQAARQIPDPASPIGFRIGIVDSGDVDIYGLELDTQLAVTDNLAFDGALGLTDYDLKDPAANSGPNLFPSQASPTFNVGGTYSVPLTQAGQVTFNVNYAYVGSQETHPTADTDSSYELPSYGLVNARLQWTSPSQRNVVTLFANNLLDETYANYATRFGGGYWDHPSGAGPAAPLRSARNVVRGRPRDYGLTFQHNFQ